MLQTRCKTLSIVGIKIRHATTSQMLEAWIGLQFRIEAPFLLACCWIKCNQELVRGTHIHVVANLDWRHLIGGFTRVITRFQITSTECPCYF